MHNKIEKNLGNNRQKEDPKMEQEEKENGHWTSTCPVTHSQVMVVEGDFGAGWRCCCKQSWASILGPLCLREQDCVNARSFVPSDTKETDDSLAPS